LHAATPTVYTVQALRNVASVLKPGTGRVQFRDYADGDMAQTRLQDSQGVKHIRGNFYARGDGTCCYYFGQVCCGCQHAVGLAVCDGVVTWQRGAGSWTGGAKGMEEHLCTCSVTETRTTESWLPLLLLVLLLLLLLLQDELSALFASEGFVCEDSLIHARTIENRKSGVKMPRRWVQAVFRFDPAQQPPQPLVVSEEPQQQQQQQQEEHAPPQQQQNGDAQADPSSLDNVCASSSRGDDSCSSCVSCAGKTWLLPSYLAAVHAGSSSSSSPRPCSQQGCCICLAEALVALVQEQQLQLLGRCVLLAPSWLCIQQQQQQQLASGRQHLLQVQHVQQASQQSPCVVCCDQADSNRLRAAEGAQQAGGAAVALLALVAVWLGARRVYVCLPAEGGSRQHAAVSGATEAFSEAFHAVLGLNECRVVVERIRPKRWQQGDVRQAAAMQRELVQALERGLPACNGLVILAGASSAAACDSAGGSQQLLDAVCRVGMSPQAAPLQLVVCAPGLLPGGVGA
jgi:hypothetical protein